MTSELDRLRNSPPEGDSPGGMGTVRFIGRCAGDAAGVLAIAKQTLAAALRLAESGVFQEDAWLTALPSQFVKNSAPHPSQDEIAREFALPLEDRIRLQAESRWSVQMFMNSFLPEFDMRVWAWWDAVVLDQNHIAVAVEVDGWPFPWQSLRWLFRGAGAIDLEPEV